VIALFRKFIVFVLALLSFGIEKKDDFSAVNCTISQSGQSEKIGIKTIENLYYNSDIEDYIIGVVAAEMPVTFNEEALMAQAVASRTYTIYELEKGKSISDIFQAHIDKSQLRSKWGNNFDEYYNKVKNAVYSTKGEIMIFENEPVLAVFCSSSGGKTESSENVWGSPLPYLKTVSSEWDSDAPNFETAVTIDKNDFFNKLGTKETTDIKITERTPADYVKTVSVGNKLFSGSQFRQIFNLKSTDFNITLDNENAVITTKGYGHGVGMSQYGAEFMAQSGNTYHEILKHYYTNVDFAVIENK
jgi:stage II sporulation protein D